MKHPRIRVMVACTCLLVTGCMTNGSSEGSSNSSQSESSNSSGDSSNSSGESSQGSGDSSQNSGESSQNSGQWSSEATKNTEGTTNNSADATRGSSENSKSSQSRSSEATSGPVLSSTLVGTTVGGLGLAIWKILVSIPAAPAPAAVGQAAQVYLRANTHQLREDLALGAGPTIEDLAAMAGIRRANLGAFGRLLRAHRGELLSLADSATLTPERALVWLERVGQLARTEPRLEEDRRAFLAIHGLEE